MTLRLCVFASCLCFLSHDACMIPDYVEIRNYLCYSSNNKCLDMPHSLIDYHQAAARSLPWVDDKSITTVVDRNNFVYPSRHS